MPRRRRSRGSPGASDVPTLLESIRRVFGQDGVTLLHRSGDDWRVDATSGPVRADRASRSRVRGRARRRSCPAAQPRACRDEDSRVLDAFAAELASSIELRELERRGLRRRRASGSQRAADGAPLGRLARPPHAALRDQGLGHEPAPARRRLEPEAQRSFLETIDEETDRLNALVGNLLDMSRLADRRARRLADRRSGSRRSSPPTLASLGSRADAIEVDVAETLPRVLADPGLLERALANIVGNAVGLAPPDVPGADRRRRGRGRRRPSRRRPRPGHRGRRSRAHLPAVPAPRRLGRAARASVSASPSRKGSSRRWAASSSSRTRRAAA